MSMDETGNRGFTTAGFTEELLETRDSVIRFQRYLAKRAWGIFYAAFALLISEFLALEPVLYIITGNAAFSSYFSAAADLVSFGVILYFIHAFFQKSRNTGRLFSQGLESEIYRPGGGNAKYILFALYVAVILTASLPALGVPFYVTETAQFAVFAGFALIMRRSSIWTFGKLPVEGILGISSFFAGSLLTIPISLFGLPDIAFLLDWGTVVFIWLLCSIFSLYSAPDELGVGNAYRD